MFRNHNNILKILIDMKIFGQKQLSFRGTFYKYYT